MTYEIGDRLLIVKKTATLQAGKRLAIRDRSFLVEVIFFDEEVVGVTYLEDSPYTGQNEAFHVKQLKCIKVPKPFRPVEVCEYPLPKQKGY